MATTDLSLFRGQGILSKVVLQPQEESASPIELANLATIHDLERTVGGAGFPSGGWRVSCLAIACDFGMSKHDDAVFNRVYARLNASLVAPNVADGLSRTLERPSAKTIRAAIQVTGGRIPTALESLDGWRSFRFESLRTLFQFKPANSQFVDEEFHERLRHALRNLTRHFQAAA